MRFLLSKSLRRLSKLYDQALVKAMPELLLEHDADILLLLASSSDVHTQKGICEALQLDKSRLAILIEGLKNKGSIYTERNPADRREHFVFLTGKGKDSVPKIHEAIEKVDLIVNGQIDKNKLFGLSCKLCGKCNVTWWNIFHIKV